MTRRGGILVVSTPGLYPIHPSPLACWRILPDGYRVLFPDERWMTRARGAWGDAARVAWEYAHNEAFPYGPPHMTVESAVQLTTWSAPPDELPHPPYAPGTDDRCPLILWWVGEKR